MRLIKKFLEDSKKQKLKDTPYPTVAFRSIMSTADAFLGTKGRSDSEKITILNYLIDILKVDLCSAGIVEPYIIQPSKPFSSPFPKYIYDENGNIIKTSCGKQEIVLENTDIYVRPWNVGRQFRSILNLKDKEFVYEDFNHFSHYYKDINLCYVYNGNHSINAGRYFKKGKIISECHDITLFYPHCYTDGVHWYNSHTNGIIDDVNDFRLAAIYELARRRYFIQSKINELVPTD